VRTTIRIDDHLLSQAKQVAARTDRTLGEVVEDALRVALAAPAAIERDAVDFPTFGGSGLRPGVDLDDKDALAALLDDDERPRAAG
jgi:hypothetical protein